MNKSNGTKIDKSFDDIAAATQLFRVQQSILVDECCAILKLLKSAFDRFDAFTLLVVETLSSDIRWIINTQRVLQFTASSSNYRHFDKPEGELNVTSINQCTFQIFLLIILFLYFSCTFLVLRNVREWIRNCYYKGTNLIIFKIKKNIRVNSELQTG